MSKPRIVISVRNNGFIEHAVYLPDELLNKVEVIFVDHDLAETDDYQAARFTNRYRHDDCEATMMTKEWPEWDVEDCDSTHNDRCPECGVEIEPYESFENSYAEYADVCGFPLVGDTKEQVEAFDRVF